MPTAYDAYNPTQAKFLSALALGESKGGPEGLMQGVGGADLSGLPTDQYGFPQWNGFGNSHAAGWFQFQPGTFDEYAARYNLNFQRPDDQKAAAWYLAQDTYAKKTGGDLTTALEAGDYATVQSALRDKWPSVTGNGATPGLAAALSNNSGVDVSTANPISADTSLMGQVRNWAMGATGASAIASQFTRIALLVVGVVVVLIALWYLLAQTGAVPSPTDAAKVAAKVALV